MFRLLLAAAPRFLRLQSFLGGAVAVLGLLSAQAAPPQVWAGGDNTCAVVNGGAYCWGRNADGQVGNGTFATATAPTAVQGLSSGVTFIATGGAHSCAIVNGGAYCWGNNGYGQLGNGGGANSAVPVPVTGLSSGVTSIGTGLLHTCAVHNGAVKCWGSGGYGQLGTGATIYSSAVPVQVSGLTGGATDVTTGTNHSCAIVAGAAYCWGRGDSGEQGTGASIYISQSPVALGSFSSGVSVMVGGDAYTCGIQNGAAKCWGFDTGGRLGNGDAGSSNVPQQVVGLTSGVTAVAAGKGYHACAVAGGVTQCWGLNNSGQLGDPAIPSGATTPSPVAGLPSPMLDVSAGGLHTCATDATRVYCWGNNDYGQLGNGTQTGSGTPLLILTVPPPPANPARLSNISTRGQVLTGNDVMIGGFVIDGATPKKVLITARGPSLAAFGIANPLANPKIELFSGQTLVASNDNWQQNSAADVAAITSLGIFPNGLAPSNPNEAALLVTLNPGAYTAVVAGADGGTGVGIVEVFEQDKPDVPLINISTRGQVQTGTSVMIGGFIIQGDESKTVLITARGPSLAAFGIANPLANPKLEIFSGQTKIYENDNWKTQLEAAGGAVALAAIQALGIFPNGLAPSNDNEAALLVTLPPGAYTAVVSGADGGTGVGIVEVFAP